MGVLNRILLILILLAAAGATVLSYFLFEKRNDMLKGWGLMADQIDKAAKIMDADIAKKINVKEMSHRDLQTMGNNLEHLSSGVKKLSEHRTALAEKTKDILDIVGISVEEQKLADINQYDNYADQLKKDMIAYKKLNDEIANQFSRAGNSLGIVSFSANSIKSTNGDRGKAYVDAINKAVNRKNAEIATRDSILKVIATDVGVANQNYKVQKNNPIIKKFADQKSALNAANKKVGDLTNRNNKLEKEVTSLTKSNARYINENKVQQARIQELEKKINPTNDANINKIVYDNKDTQYYLNLYSLVKAEVKRVDSKWNFVVIDLGAKKKIRQTFAGKTFVSELEILPGKTMTVVRGIATKNPKVIGKITLRNVFSDHVIADIDTNTLLDKIQEGDAVIFLKEDLEKIRPEIDKLLTKKVK